MLKAYLKNVVTQFTSISERISGSLQFHYSKSIVLAYTFFRQFGQHRVWVNQLSMHLLWNMCPHASSRVFQPFTAFRQIVQEILEEEKTTKHIGYIKRLKTKIHSELLIPIVVSLPWLRRFVVAWWWRTAWTLLFVWISIMEVVDSVANSCDGRCRNHKGRCESD